MTDSESSIFHRILTLGLVLLGTGLVSLVATRMMAKRFWVPSKWVWSAHALGTLLGFGLCFAAYSLSQKVTIHGFPFPAAILIEKVKDRWIDYISSWMPAVFAGNFLVGLGFPSTLLATGVGLLRFRPTRR